MALNAARNWLIAYDISEPRRLRRVHRFLVRHAVPVQYSVFATRASPIKLGEIRAGLAEIIDAREDDVRIYPIPEPADLAVYGRKALPEGLRIIEGRSSVALGPFASGRRGDNINVDR